MAYEDGDPPVAGLRQMQIEKVTVTREPHWPTDPCPWKVWKPSKFTGRSLAADRVEFSDAINVAQYVADSLAQRWQ